MITPPIPFEHLISITKSDVTVYSPPLRGLYVGASGDVKIDDALGNAVTLVGLAAGVFHWVRATKVYSTGTTATGIVGAY